MAMEPPSWASGEGMTPPRVPPTPPGTYGNAPGVPGYGPQPGSSYGAPPPAAKRPPKKLWFVIGAVLLILGLVTVGIGVSTIVNVMGSAPTAEHTFASGGSTKVHIDAGARKLIFENTRAAQHYIHCDVSSPDVGTGIKIKQYDGTLTLNQWHAAFTVDVPQASDYTIACKGEPGDTFGVADDGGVGGLVVGILCSIGGGLAAMLGVAILVIAAIVRARRRRT
jgi:hypothetical protein